MKKKSNRKKDIEVKFEKDVDYNIYKSFLIILIDNILEEVINNDENIEYFPNF